MGLDHEALSGAIIGAAVDVHKALGPGFLESVYEAALVLELQSRGIPFQRQVSVPVIYKEIEVGLHRLDLFVANRIVVEIKAVQSFEHAHFVVVRSYLSAVHCCHGLLLNFSKPILHMKRVMIRDPP